jgi:hypothetical protein
MPEIWDKAQVAGKWVWLEFNVPPLEEVRAKLNELGFCWNRETSRKLQSDGFADWLAQFKPDFFCSFTDDIM